MLDPNYIRENIDKVKKGAGDRGLDPELIDQWLELDERWRGLLQKVEKLRKQRNELICDIKKRKERPLEDKVKKGKEFKEEIKKLEKKLFGLKEKWQEALMAIPNLPASDVPIGKDENENLVVRKWGEPTKFDFEPKDHLEIGENLGLIDVKRAGKVSGSRFGYLTGDAVLLEFALVQFALETLTKEGFVPVVPPVMIKKRMESGLGYAEHGGWNDMYVLDNDDLVLVATAEHSLVARYSGEVFGAKDLPRRYVGFSTCFRREAGTYGKDTRGILRVHQFDKVEMVSFVNPRNSDKEHEYLVSLEEKLMQALKLPYRIAKMCTGDLAQPQTRRYDLETWMPGQNKYRETHSCSNCTDYQARRLEIKFSSGGVKNYLHILNGTAYAIGRTIIAILENYQQKDGSVVVPEVLRKWVGRDRIIKS